MVAKDFYTVANNLLNNLCEPEEAVFRTIVGRAYYSVYLQTRTWMNHRFPLDLDSTEGNSHSKYTNCLKALQRKHFDLSLSRFARELEELKEKRHFADYEVNEDDILGEVNTKAALLQANKLLSDLESLIIKYP
ncbi:hypothetical protein B7L44_05395 [Acinetobacter nosocomialis]|uniref:hypothetical protein n=1 Tax=Acinetobacter nosocomialis TaxID=106654 RepID=UPI0009E10967|nr:hypothetical protein [Acinetobacter nosocomialis]ARG16075.1 hypothetical protein B7L44_05395 [Acinetobacter nosocomialis]